MSPVPEANHSPPTAEFKGARSCAFRPHRPSCRGACLVLPGIHQSGMVYTSLVWFMIEKPKYLFFAQGTVDFIVTVASNLYRTVAKK